MEPSKIIKVLVNSGYRGTGPGGEFIEDGTYLFLSDPSCVMRGVDVFLNYAMWALFIAAAALLLGYAISVIRRGDPKIANNMRNLMIIFAAAGAVKPTANLIWGDDLWSRACDTIAVPWAELERMDTELNAAKNAMNGGNFESLVITDSLEEEDINTTLRRVREGDPEMLMGVGDPNSAGAVNEDGTPRTIKYSSDSVNTYSSSVPIGNPLQGNYRISSGFGPRNTGISGASTNHKGIDFACPVGTPVYTMADGKVSTYIQNSGACGIGLEITHANGLVTQYCHLSQAIIQQGQSVRAGDMIAKSGNTGVSSGPHLHYAMKLNGVAFNPISYVNGAVGDKGI